MLPVFADPKTDCIFRRIFGVEARKPLLIALLNDLLELDGERCIRDVAYLLSEQRVRVPELRLSIVDVTCTDASGRRFVVKIQVLTNEAFEKRVVYDACKTYVMQSREAGEDRALGDVVGVTICNFLLWPERDESGRFRVPMLSRWRLQAQHEEAPGQSQVQYVFLELPKYAAGEGPQTTIERWAYFFREAKTLEAVPPALAEGPFREALDATRTATFSAGEWLAYDRSKMAEQDARGALAVAYNEGLALGRAESKAWGKQEGLRKGKAAALITVLAARELAVDDEARGRIEACDDPARLDRWLVRALTAASAREVLDDDPEGGSA